MLSKSGQTNPFLLLLQLNKITVNTVVHVVKVCKTVLELTDHSWITCVTFKPSREYDEINPLPLPLPLTPSPTSIPPPEVGFYAWDLCSCTKSNVGDNGA